MNSNTANFQKDMKKSVFMISNILIFELSLFLVPLFLAYSHFSTLPVFFLTFSSCLIASQAGTLCDIH